MRYIYLHHSMMDSRHLYGLFVPGRQPRIFLVDSARNRPQVPNPSKMYSEVYRNLPESVLQSSLIAYPETISPEFSAHTTEAAALKALAKELGAHRRGPNLLVIRSPQDVGHFYVKHNIFNEFPIIMAALHADDVHSSLMWVLHATKAMVRDYCKLSGWLKSQIEHAEHYDVPLGVSLPLCEHGLCTNLQNRLRTFLPIWDCSWQTSTLLVVSIVKIWCFGGQSVPNLI